MFLKKVELKAATKVFKKQSQQRLEDLTTTYILYSDEGYWDEDEWSFMLDNVVFQNTEGFYIRANLFKGYYVSESCETEEVS